MPSYYNEFDPNAAAWLRELIREGLIPDGHVDERSICDVQPNDLKDYNQCHFFAGIAGWPIALQLAGVPSDQPLWTGSCPCQPFSCAGSQKGTADSRHLWPEFARLIRVCRPPVVFGEQVESAVRHGWLDGVFADLEAEGYTCGATVLGAHSVGAPHIRQRLYWVAFDNSQRRNWEQVRLQPREPRCSSIETSGRSGLGGMADAERDGRRLDEPGRGPEGRTADRWTGEDVRMANAPLRGQRADGGTPGSPGHAEQCGEDGRCECGCDEPWCPQCQRHDGWAESDERLRPYCRQHTQWLVHSQQPRLEGRAGDVGDGDQPRRQREIANRPVSAAGGATGRVDDATGSRCALPGIGAELPDERLRECGPEQRRGSMWSDFRIIHCRDVKARRVPVEPALFPLADGFSGSRVGLLRGAGNAIVPQVAAAFIEEVMSCIASDCKIS